MTPAEFRNALKLMMYISVPDLHEAGVIDENWGKRFQPHDFVHSPFREALRMPDANFEKLCALIESRQPTKDSGETGLVDRLLERTKLKYMSPNGQECQIVPLTDLYEVGGLVERLLAGLEGVTPGHWQAHWDNEAAPGSDYYVTPTGNGCLDAAIATEMSEKDAAHFANCSPDNIRTLLDTIDGLRARLAEVEGEKTRASKTR